MPFRNCWTCQLCHRLANSSGTAKPANAATARRMTKPSAAKCDQRQLRAGGEVGRSSSDQKSVDIESTRERAKRGSVREMIVAAARGRNKRLVNDQHARRAYGCRVASAA